MDANGWMPIESAPKDGTRIIALRPTDPPHIECMEWSGGPAGFWFWTYDGDSPDLQPTHWKPIGSLPETADGR